jgi:PTS system mannose-specific IIA component
MTGLVLVTHAGLAGALKASAEMIVGPIEGCASVEVASGEQADGIMARVVAAVESVSADGAIIMTDLFGGTPSNMAMSFLKEGRVEVLTGVNLPMLLKFFTYRERLTLSELAELLQGYARDGIVLGSAVLSGQP